MTYKVEFLTAKDYVWAVEDICARSLVEEMKRPDMLNRERLYKLVSIAIDEKTCLVCKKDGVGVGLIAWTVTENPFNPDQSVAYEVIWYVLPEFRKITRASYLLIKAYAEIIDSSGIQGTLSLRTENEVSDTILRKFGFLPTEKIYFKN